MSAVALPDRWLRFVAKPLVFVLCLVPFLILAYGTAIGDLGANPLERVTDVTGEWGLRFLLFSLAVTPLRQLTGMTQLLRFRRMLGLFAFFYVSLHFLTWLGLDQQFSWNNIVADIAKRPYVTVGFLAWLLLVPLAVTSTKGMMRRLGRRWKSLHKLIYLIAPLGVLHYVWLVKADVLEPAIYGGILAVLLAIRLRRQRASTTSRVSAALKQNSANQL